MTFLKDLSRIRGGGGREETGAGERNEKIREEVFMGRKTESGRSSGQR